MKPKHCDKMPTLLLKTRWCVSLAIVVLTACYSFAQQRTASIKAHTLWVPIGLYTCSFEQAFTKHFSGQLSLEGGTYIKVQPNSHEDYKAKGFAVIGAVRYYPFTKKLAAPQGFFTYAAFRGMRFHDTYTSTNGVGRHEGDGYLLNIGGGLGYKFVYRRQGIEGFIGWGAGGLTRTDNASSMPEHYRQSLRDQKHFPQLDLALCYMLSPF